MGTARPLIIVRRQADDRFRHLERTFAPDGIEIHWDRRRGERRRGGTAGPDRRQHQRRQPPPITWTALDFVLILPSSDAPATQ